MTQLTVSPRPSVPHGVVGRWAGQGQEPRWARDEDTSSTGTASSSSHSDEDKTWILLAEKDKQGRPVLSMSAKVNT